MHDTPDTEWTATDAQQRITAFWNTVSDHYDGEPGNVPRAESAEERAWLSTLASLLSPAPQRVLDVGTGTGFVANLAASLGHSVTGIDLAEAMLGIARQNAMARGVDTTFCIGDAISPPFAPRSFDVVINRSLLWTLLGLDQALTAWRTVLRQDGRLICIYGLVEDATDDVSDLRPQSSSRGAFFDDHYPMPTRRRLAGMHFTEHRPLIELVEDAGFRSPQVQRIDIGGAKAAHYALVANPG